ncbi:MAG: YqgE/AlgH family protein [Betaproteobacteria bacterium]|nr:YqgE/AlgH family protein [Betaproteobacteria bacterium]
MLRVLLLVLGLLPAAAAAQQPAPPNSLLLIAKPTLADPNFARTVVLVTQAEDASTVGVILNRPLQEKLQAFLPQDLSGEYYKDRVFQGGPVMRRVILSVFRSATAPQAPAFPVLKGVYLTMHPANIRALLADPASQYRIYAGFSGWAPNQLQSEFMRDGWYVLPADAETVFRRNTEGMWEEMIRRATKPKPTT